MNYYEDTRFQSIVNPHIKDMQCLAMRLLNQRFDYYHWYKRIFENISHSS